MAGHQLDFVSILEHQIRHRFPNSNAGDLAGVVVQAFQMLHVQGGVNVDAGFLLARQLVVLYFCGVAWTFRLAVSDVPYTMGTERFLGASLLQKSEIYDPIAMNTDSVD